MSRAMLYWVLMIIWLVFGLWSDYVPGQPYPVRLAGRSFLIFILLAILGWQVFGTPVR